MSDIRQNRREAERELLSAFVGRQMEAGKWLLASLLVVNTGAVALVLSSNTISPLVRATSVPYFIGGIIAAFLAGAGSWWVSDTTYASLRHKIGVRLFKLETVSTDKTFWWSFKAGIIFTIVAGVASLSLFSYGALQAAKISVEKQETTANGFNQLNEADTKKSKNAR